MFKLSNLVRGASIAAGVIALAAASAATAGDANSAAAKPTDRTHNCFFVSQWRGWKAPEPDVLYLGVNLKDVYKVQLSAKSPELMWPDARLISITRGSSTICDALDLDLKVAGAEGFPIGLIATSITKLTPEQVAAIPPKFQPN
ncbi:MAG TPA: DUF6491 family protein [Caulobacteraceae bacterium]|jgi:hypothetical protein|nr:DUF6491 family protein [Caulobacteraceae bacterium]